MPDFVLVAAPVFSPTECRTCMTHTDKRGFIDTRAEDGNGHVYICATCVDVAARLVGCLDPKQADDLRHRVADAHNAITSLERELEAERENKFVSLADVRELVTPVRTPPSKEQTEFMEASNTRRRKALLEPDAA